MAQEYCRSAGPGRHFNTLDLHIEENCACKALNLLCEIMLGNKVKTTTTKTNKRPGKKEKKKEKKKKNRRSKSLTPASIIKAYVALSVYAMEVDLMRQLNPHHTERSSG